MLESLKDNLFKYQKLSLDEQKKRGILGRFEGVIADFRNPTRNGRKYSEKLWEQVFENPLMQEKIANRCCFGELGHPADRTETDMEKIAICLSEIPKKGNDGKLYGVFDILDTPNGRILKSLCDYGCIIGVSSRGSGDTFTDMDGQEAVDPDTYECEGWDAVIIPAVKEARMQMVTESLNKSRYNKTLRQSLIESIAKASDDDRKVMLETLNNIGISLNEEKEEINEDMLDYNIQSQENWTKLFGVHDPQEAANSIGKPVQYNNEIYYPGILKNGTGMDVKHVKEKRIDFEKVKDANETQNVTEELIPFSEAKSFISKYREDHNLPPVSDNQIREFVELLKGVSLIEDTQVVSQAETEMLNESVDSELYHKVCYEITKAFDKNKDINRDTKQAVIEWFERTFRPAQEPVITDESLNINEEHTAVVNNEAIVEELQTLIKQKQELEARVNELQEKLSVSYAEGTKKEDKLNSQQQIINKLSTSSRKAQVLTERVKALENELKTAQEELDSKKSNLNESLNEAKVRNNKLTEAISKKNVEISSLNEDINNYKDKVKSLNESIDRLTEENKSNKVKYSQKLNEAKKLTEKYKGIATKSVDKYIDGKAITLGISANEIKNRLPESYSLNDVDKICESLQTCRVNLNKLPFNTDNISMRFTASKNESILPRNDVDEISDFELSLFHLK